MAVDDSKPVTVEGAFEGGVEEPHPTQAAARKAETTAQLPNINCHRKKLLEKTKDLLKSNVDLGASLMHPNHAHYSRY